ncbi:hypothetical protein [Hydrogenimonas sp.]
MIIKVEFKTLFLAVAMISSTAVYGNDSNTSNEGYIDALHRSLSESVLEWSDATDRKLSGWIGAKGEKKPQSFKNGIERKREKADTYFQNKKFLEETENTYLRIRFDQIFQSREENKFNIKVDANLPLTRSQKRFNFFIEGLTKDNADKTFENVDNKQAAPSLGINYFAPKAYGIASKYSVGVHGINPYVRARYNKVFESGRWAIEPVQTFEYSAKYKFEERTDLYFDTSLSKSELFRFQLSRKTQTDVDGMDYAAALSYFSIASKATGWRISQIFWGNTEYRYKKSDGTMSDKYGGISNYRTEIGWRRNVFRKWFFYELTPSVNFKRDYDYKPNYAFRITADIYFGNYHW